MKRRDLLKQSAAFASISFFPSSVWSMIKNGHIRTAHIGVGGMGGADLKSISSHSQVKVAALCDVDAKNLAKAQKAHSGAQGFSDYRKLLDQVGKECDAVIVSTPDHTHAPASLAA
ncbi:MAG: Gfo/Idh/MocA family oxidoreductase, partial [Bacteroidota bacterium]